MQNLLKFIKIYNRYDNIAPCILASLKSYFWNKIAKMIIYLSKC